MWAPRRRRPRIRGWVLPGFDRPLKRHVQRLWLTAVNGARPATPAPGGTGRSGDPGGATAAPAPRGMTAATGSCACLTRHGCRDGRAACRWWRRAGGAVDVARMPPGRRVPGPRRSRGVLGPTGNGGLAMTTDQTTVLPGPGRRFRDAAGAGGEPGGPDRPAGRAAGGGARRAEPGGAARGRPPAAGRRRPFRPQRRRRQPGVPGAAGARPRPARLDLGRAGGRHADGRGLGGEDRRCSGARPPRCGRWWRPPSGAARSTPRASTACWPSPG